jgi:hypothetical protein
MEFMSVRFSFTFLVVFFLSGQLPAPAQTDTSHVRPWFIRLQFGPAFGFSGWQHQALSDPLVQFPARRFGWQAGGGYAFSDRWELGFTVQGAFEPGQAISPDFIEDLRRINPGSFVSATVYEDVRQSPYFFLEHTAFKFPVKRWKIRAGLLAGIVRVQVSDGSATVKDAHAGEMIRTTWTLVRKSDPGQQRETFFTLGGELSAEYPLRRQLGLILSASRLLSQPNLDFVVHSKNQQAGTESIDTIRYRKLMRVFRLGAGFAWRWGKGKAIPN